MYEFLDIFNDVMRIVTFQPSRQPGRDVPERGRGALDAGYRFRERKARIGADSDDRTLRRLTGMVIYVR